MTIKYRKENLQSTISFVIDATIISKILISRIQWHITRIMDDPGPSWVNSGSKVWYKGHMSGNATDQSSIKK